MSVESPENFNSGDVVWVKLGSSWWPGEVKDAEELPNDILEFKKPPLVIVKFFDEDSYEYIKSWANVYPYNCEKKNEFIKKGMAAFRSKVPHMEKFPKDVLTAESKVGGNPNILSNPMFAPDKKKNYAAEIFGTPSPKVKPNKDKRKSNSKSSQKNTAHITHRRFLGVDDYRAYICIQYPGKDRIPGDKEDEEVLRINQEPEQEFNCHRCSFTTKRLEVMILHTKSHIQGVYVSSPRKNKQSAVRKKKEKTKKSKNTGDVIEAESSSSEEPVRERKRKPKSQSTKESKVKKTEEKDTPNQSIDIRNELLAVWDDSNDDDDEFDVSLDKLGKSQTLSQSTLEGVLSGTIVESADESLNQSMDDILNKSEALGEMVEETLEQIRAEVINPSEVEVKNLSEALNQSVEEALTESVEETQDMFAEQSKTHTKEAPNQSAPPEEASKESIDEAANQLVNVDSPIDKEIVKEKSKPEGAIDGKETEKSEKKMDRDIQEAIKSCFDFDEDEEEDNAIVSKAAVGGRKIPRVIPLTDRRKSKDIIVDDLNRDSGCFSGGRQAKAGHSDEAEAAFKELMEMTTVPELPEVRNTLKCEQNFHNIKTIKFPDKPESVASPPKVVTKPERKDSSEVATKLTNPKKRFVKSFEDFELMQNEIRRKEELGELAKNEEIESRPNSAEEKSVASSSAVSSNFDDFDSSGSLAESAAELSKLKSTIMSRIIEEANINEESKNKIMSKIQEPKVESDLSKRPSYKEERKLGKASHRTPRSKILESYMKDTNNQKAQEHEKEKAEEQRFDISQSRIIVSPNNREDIDDRTRQSVTRKNIVPPKKNKWSRRGSHPKKDRNLFILENIGQTQKDDKPEEESVKFDAPETVVTDKAQVSNDNVVEKFVPFSKANETILAREIPGQKVNVEMHLEDKSEKIVFRQEDNENVLPKYIESDQMTIDEGTDKVTSALRDKETDEVHLKDNQTGKLSLKEQEINRLLSKYGVIDTVSPIVEEQFSLKHEREVKSPLKDEGIEKPSSNNESNERTSSKNEEIEKSSSKDVGINQISSKDKEIEKSSPEDEEMEKISSKNKELEQSSLKDDEIEKLPSKDDEIEKLSSKDEEIEMSSNNKEIETASSKDVETEKSFSKDEEIEKQSSKDEEIEKSFSNNEEIEKEPLKDDETEKSSSKDEKIEKESSNDDEIEKSSSKDEKIEKESSNDDEIEKFSSKDEQIESSVLKDNEIENPVLKDKIESPCLIDMIEKSVLKDREIEKSTLIDEEIEKPSLVNEEIEKPALKDGNIGKLFCNQDSACDTFEDQDPNISPKGQETDEMLPFEVEESVKLPLRDEETMDLSSKEEESVDIEVPDTLSTDIEESDEVKLVSVESEIIHMNEGASDLLPKEMDQLPTDDIKVVDWFCKENVSNGSLKNEEEAEPITKEVTAVEEMVKLNSSDCISNQKESIIVDNKAPLNNYDQNNCVIPLHEPLKHSEHDGINSGVVLEEVKLVAPQEMSLSPRKDVLVSMDNSSLVSPKTSICSPPKKSKKRKMSERNFLNVTKTDPLEVEHFSPLEKRKKESRDKETLTLEKHDVDISDLGTLQGIEESYESDILDNGTEINKLVDTAPENDVETTCAMTVEPVVDLIDHINKVEIQCASSSVESFKFSIQTNLSNLTSREEISALALATLSEIKADLKNSDSSIPEIRPEQPEVIVEDEDVRAKQPQIGAEKLEVAEVHQETRAEQPEIEAEKLEVEAEHQETKAEQPEIEAEKLNVDVEHQETRAEQPEIGVEKLEKIVEHQEIGSEQPETCTEQPEIIVEDPKVRAEQPELTTDKQEISAEQPEIAAEQQEIIVDNHEIRDEQSEIIVDEQEIRDEQSEIIVDEQEIKDEQSEIIVDNQEIRDEQSGIIVDKQEIGDEQSEIIVDRQEITDEQSEIIVDNREIRDEESEIIVENPEIKVDQPGIIVEHPVIGSDHPGIIVEHPEIRVGQPEIIVEHPEIRAEQPEIIVEHPVKRAEQPVTRVGPKRGIVLPIPTQSELVPIEGNLTVVSEKDLAYGQVEITSEKVISPRKPITLSNFSMDFSDSGSDSNSNSISDSISDSRKIIEFTSKGTEFTSKAITKQVKRMNKKKKENAYERLELLNILEGNSDSEKKPKEYQQLPKKTIMEDICDFEEHIPSQIVCAKGVKRGLIDIEGDFVVKEKSQKMSERSTASKHLDRLTGSKNKITPSKINVHSEMTTSEGMGKFPMKTQSTPSTTRQTRYFVKSKTPVTINKPIILSEQIIKAAETKSKPKRMLNDIEDVEAFVIHKDPKKNKPEEEVVDVVKAKSASPKSAGKAKILQQTIITPAGEIIQPTVNQVQTDDNIFDINSMPIVLSDEILTPESIENMPIVIGTETKSADHDKSIRKPTQGRIITKTTVATPPPSNLNKIHTIAKHSKPPRILQTVSSKIVKNSPLLPTTAKPGKYIIVPQSGMQQNKYISTTKKPSIVKRSPVPTGILTKVPNIAPEPSGNKIMIVTNQQGQQQRLLLTPAQQKMLGYQNQKVAKTVMKGNMLQKSVLATKTMPIVEAGTSGVMSKSPSIIGQKVVVGTNSSPSLITTTSHQVISNQGRNIKNVTKRMPATNQKIFSNTAKQKTILIKNQHGQTVRKIQGTDDELLDKQVAEQLEAIKASSGMKFSPQPKQTETYKMAPKSNMRRSYSKKIEMKPKLVPPPPLTGIHQSPKTDKLTTMTFPAAKKVDAETKPIPPAVSEEAKTQSDRPLNQLVIQDAVGNQTTITEGQILALPSETVDGQPQSYMLVTLDESGNLTPLNSEALMSLDPNLGLGGDLSNMVLQIDQGALTERPQTIPIKTTGIHELAKTVVVESATTVPVPVTSVTPEIRETPVIEQKVEPIVEMPQAIVPSTNGDPGQQLIVTGDPIATQKFLESLTEGTTDLANILANADGNSILIQADGQQILINTNSDNQMLLSMNNDSINVSESTEGGGNPIFATQPNKNQDILAAALADTDVFQQEQHSTQGKITSQLSPNNTLYPMNVGNVLETSLTLSSPIMTPLEVPSTNSKKIPDEEADILTQVPKNVDLPITITDPNIAHTVSNQQLIANELQTNLELTLPISETTISAVSTDMNSPSFVYSLPTLDDAVDMTQKPFNSSMPLLNEDVEDNSTSKKTDEDEKLGTESLQKDEDGSKSQGVNSEGCFLEEEEGRFTLGGEMCSSLSEPPPEMFDLPESASDASDNASKEDDTTDLSTQSSEGSCEIPLQPQIVTKSLDLSQNLDSLKRSLEGSKGDSKKCKFD